MPRTLHLAGVVTLLCLVAGLAFAHGAGIQLTRKGFEPAKVTVPVGQVVHFTCMESVPRGLQIVGDEGSFRSPRLARGEGFHYSFEKPGIYRYHLQQDPSVKGVIIVEAPKG